MRGLFVTGTDTDCGKTVVSCALVRQLRRQGVGAVGMKPVASGARVTPQGLRNADAEALRHASGGDVPYALLNPYVFEPAIAPHLAAAQVGVAIESPVILHSFEQLASRHEMVVVEGVGGWRVPLGEQLDVAALCQALDLPVLLVVGMRLGCINHALLTAESIAQSSSRLAGWVANQLDPEMDCFAENLQSLQTRLPAPCLGVFPHRAADEDVESVESTLNLDLLAYR